MTCLELCLNSQESACKWVNCLEIYITNIVYSAKPYEFLTNFACNRAFRTLKTELDLAQAPVPAINMYRAGRE